MSNLQPLEAVDCGSKTQTRVFENLNNLSRIRVKNYAMLLSGTHVKKHLILNCRPICDQTLHT